MDLAEDFRAGVALWSWSSSCGWCRRFDPFMSRPVVIDLDQNATTRPLPAVLDLCTRHALLEYANPGSRHQLGRAARRVLEQAREQIACGLDARPEELIFTSGGTESNNLALLGLARKARGTLLLTGGEHPAIRSSAQHLQDRGWRILEFPLLRSGQIDPACLDTLPWEEIDVVSIILAHNETGVIQDVSLIGERCRERNIPLHLDAVQAVGKISVSFRQLQAATLAFGAHKFHGPRGIGGLVIRDGVRLQPRLFGGHQEQSLRPGTEPVWLAAGMAAALQIAIDEQPQRIAQMTRLRNRLEQGLTERAAPVVIHGRETLRLPNTASISFPGLDGEPLLVALDLAGIACSLGSTCASGSTEPSPVLVAMGLPPEEYRSAVRFSLGAFTNEAEIESAIERIAETVQHLRSLQT